MRVFVTGANGFIGTAFCRLALKQGWQVAALVRPDTPNPQLFPHPKLTILRSSLKKLPMETLTLFKPDICLHTAWVTTPGQYMSSPENMEHAYWSQQLIETLPKLNIQRFAMLGTCLEYRLDGSPLQAGITPLNPNSAYTTAKLRVLDHLKSRADQLNLQWLWARVFYPYGPGEPLQKLCSSIIQRLSQDEVVDINFPHSTKDFIYIDDLVDALWLLLSHEVTGEVNLGSGQPVTVGEVAETLARYLGKPHLLKKAEPKPDPLDQVVADIAHLTRLGWSPAYNLTDGLAAMCDAIR